MQKPKAILLLSGGIDSTNLLAQLSGEGKDIYALSFDYGQKHLVELDFAAKSAKKYGVKNHAIVNLDNSLFKNSNALTNPLLEMTNAIQPALAVVPARNTMFLSFALSYAQCIGAGGIYVAYNADDNTNFPDCSIAFVKAFNQLIALQNRSEQPIKVVAPFIEMTKVEVVKLSAELGVNLGETISCYQPIGQLECGSCLSCTLKQQAIKEADMTAQCSQN